MHCALDGACSWKAGDGTAQSWVWEGPGPLRSAREQQTTEGLLGEVGVSGRSLASALKENKGLPKSIHTASLT